MKPTNEEPASTSEQPAAQTANTAQPAPAKKSNKKLFIILGVVVFFLFILPGILFAIFVGYVANRGGEKIVEDIAKSQGVDVDLDTKDGNVSIKDKDGNEYSTKTGTDLPEDFPKEALALYSNKYTNTSRIKVGENTSWTVVIETSDSPATITPKVKEQLAAGSWAIQSESNSSDYNMIIAKKDPYSAVINYSQTDGTTTLTYTLSQTPAATE
jgi:cytoskeletal protein RodZ